MNKIQSYSNITANVSPHFRYLFTFSEHENPQKRYDVLDKFIDWSNKTNKTFEGKLTTP